MNMLKIKNISVYINLLKIFIESPVYARNYFSARLWGYNIEQNRQ